MNNAKLATRGIQTLCYHSFSTFGSEGNGLDRMRNRFCSMKEQVIIFFVTQNFLF